MEKRSRTQSFRLLAIYTKRQSKLVRRAYRPSMLITKPIMRCGWLWSANQNDHLDPHPPRARRPPVARCGGMGVFAMKRRFSPEQRLRMIWRYRKGELVKVIAYDFNCSLGTVSSIVNRAGYSDRISRRQIDNPMPAKLRVWWYRRRQETRRYSRAWLDQPRHE
jgi:hypothetical protein